MWPLEPNFQFFLAAYGLTLIITESLIFAPLRAAIADKSRTLGKLFSCSMCFGFWAGCLILLGDYFLSTELPYIVFRSGVMASGVCWIIKVILNRLGSEEL